MTVRRCNSILASLYKTRHHFTPDVLKLLVQAHVFPHIHYCLSVWGGAAKCQLQRVQKTLNFAARLVTGVRRTEHISPALQALGWERVEEMLRRHDHVLVQRALYHSLCPPALSDMFVRRAAVSSRAVAYLEIGKRVCHNLRRGADTPGAPVLMIDIRAACDTIHSIIVYLI